MSREVAEAFRGKCRVIAVNNQAIPTAVDGVLQPALAPFADVLYAADAKWWIAYKDRALAFPGRKVTIRSAQAFREFKAVYSLNQSPQRVFDERPTHLVSGGNSGYQAIHLAVHFGATRIFLCGFDMNHVDKKRHWFGNHPPRLNSRGNYAAWIVAFNRLAPFLQKRGVEVLNCSPRSALKCFKKIDLKDAVASL